jgi:hypothetical protein
MPSSTVIDAMGQTKPPTGVVINLLQSQTLAPKKDNTVNAIDVLWEKIAKDRNMDFEVIKNILCSDSKAGC